MLSIGIVGLPNVGKSTLFKALTKKQVDISNYPFCTIEPNVGIVEVPDERLERLNAVAKSPKIVPAAIEFIDIAGLVEGAHKGEGLGNQFLANIRETDMILEIVRAFEDEKIIHIDGRPEPKKDAEIIALELIMKDLETVERHKAKVEKRQKSGDKETMAEMNLSNKLVPHLSAGKPVKDLIVNEKEKLILKNLNLLSAKPILYIINCSAEKPVMVYPEWLKPALEIDAQLENEFSELSSEETKDMKKNLPAAKNSIDELISTCYALLELQSFFTYNEKEIRAWTIKKGTKAPAAAGKIHADFTKGFIRADVIFWDKLIAAGSWSQAKEKGWVKTEGKDYIAKDGDVIVFKV